MRIDPEAVYIELEPAQGMFNFERHDFYHSPACILHWKDGAKWRRKTLLPNDGEGLGDVLAHLGQWLAEKHGNDLDAALADFDSRAAVTESEPG